MSPQQYIAEQLAIWAKGFVRRRKIDIYKERLTNSKELWNSIRAEVTANPQQGMYFMEVFLNTYGRLQDMSRTYTKAGGKEMTENLKDWVSKKGVQSFVRGKYTGIYAGKSDTQLLNAIAWGIMRKYVVRKKTKKRRWWNRGKERDVNAFYGVLLKGYAEAVQAEVKRNMENNNPLQN